jgi:hypothetical protein
MIKNYFKIAWRNLFKNKGFSIINIAGLAIGMGSAILILLWVQNELTYDKFHKNYDHVYQVIANRNFDRVFTDRSMVMPLASELEMNLPQIKHAVVTTYQQQHVLAQGESKIKKKGYTVGEHFFDVFTWEFVKGNALSALKEPNTIVLTESAAKAFFGNDNPINKVLKMDNQTDLRITGVLKDPPPNSTFDFDWLTPFNYSDEETSKAMKEWQNSSWNVFVQVRLYWEAVLPKLKERMARIS